MPSDYMSSLANNIKSFIDLSNFLDSNKSGNVDNSIDNMMKISNGYTELSKGLSKLGGELNKIDTEKLMALKNLTGSIVLMSLMDSDQFEKMMSALEDKAKIFVGVMNDLDAGETSQGLKTSTSAVKSGVGSNNNQRTINDLYSVMASVDSRLASIAKSNDNVSKYVDEIRTGESPLKKDKKK
jgi:ribosome-binding factor A